MPDGRIIVAVQSTLDIDAKSKKKALFTRLVSFDPASGKTAMYGYPIDSAAYSKKAATLKSETSWRSITSTSC